MVKVFRRNGPQFSHPSVLESERSETLTSIPESLLIAHQIPMTNRFLSL
jgi:hypothetical protein